MMWVSGRVGLCVEIEVRASASRVRQSQKFQLMSAGDVCAAAARVLESHGRLRDTAHQPVVDGAIRGGDRGTSRRHCCVRYHREGTEAAPRVAVLCLQTLQFYLVQDHSPWIGAYDLSMLGSDSAVRFRVQVERCRVLEQSGCASVCVNCCKIPTQVAALLGSDCDNWHHLCPGITHVQPRPEQSHSGSGLLRV